MFYFQLDFSLISDIYIFIILFFLLFIKFYRVKEIVELEISKKLKKEEFLLNDKVYISTIYIVKKKQYIFWTFKQNEKVI